MKKAIYTIVCYLMILIGIVTILGSDWAFNNFNGLTNDQIIFHLMVPLEGVETSYFALFFKECVLWPLIIISLSFIIIFIKKKYTITTYVRFFKYQIKIKDFPWNLLKKLVLLVAIFFIIYGFLYANKKFELIDYIKSKYTDSKLIENNYVDPKIVNYIFPEKKKNLIYIYMESMESTYSSIKKGGNNPDNLIPNLTRLAEENINFSNTEKIGGSIKVPGISWTIAGMIAQTSGVPLKIPIEGNSFNEFTKFLPGVYNLGDILKNNGYKNLLMVGTDATFGGRRLFFEQHGNYDIFDINTAIEEGKIDESYDNGWWGIEDSKLYEYAKEKLISLSNAQKPFNFTMLTVDTHHIGGYIDKTCSKKYDKHYSNSIACSDYMINEFINWIKEQDFYNDTTIVISGDHLSMDTEYFKDLNQEYKRNVYNLFINSSIDAINTKNRLFSTMDMFPSTLASMGITFDNDRLGLGTNLFSNKKTIIEEYGLKTAREELDLNSNYYEKKLLYGIK